MLLRDGGMTGPLETVLSSLSSRPLVLAVSSIGLQGAAEASPLESQSEQKILREGVAVCQSSTSRSSVAKTEPHSQSHLVVGQGGVS